MSLHPIGVTVTEIVLSQAFAFLFMQLAQILPMFFFVTYVFDVSVAIILMPLQAAILWFSYQEKGTFR